MNSIEFTPTNRKLFVAIIGAGPVGLVCAAKLALSLGHGVNIEIYERRIDWNSHRGCYEWQTEESGNRRREQVVTLQDDVVDLLTHEEVHHLFDGERVWRTSRNVAIRDLEDRLLAFCQGAVSSASNIRFSRLPDIVQDKSGRIDSSKFRDWASSLDVDVVIGADGANSLTRSSFGIGRVALGSTDERILKKTDYALGIGLAAEGVDGGQRQPLNAALTLAQNRYLLNSEQGKRGYLNIRLTPDEYELLAKQNKQGSCGFANPINLYNLYREPESEGAMPLVDGVDKIEEIISEGLNLFNLSWRHVNSVVGIQITPTYADCFYMLNEQQDRRTKHVFLVGDAAMSHHFWPGRGLNTGLKSAIAVTEAIELFARSKNVEHFHRFDLFMTLLRFREMQGRSASMLRKDNSLPHWLDEIENLPANRKPSDKSLTKVILEETSKNADLYREEFLKNVLAWNSFNESSGGWPHESGAVTEAMIRQLLFTSQSRPKVLTLRTMVESAVSNNVRRAGWPIHQQRGIAKFSSEVSPEGWYVGAMDDGSRGYSLEDVKQSALQLMKGLSAREHPPIEMILSKLKLCNIDLDVRSLPASKYELLMDEGIDIIEKADYNLPTVFVLGETNAGKSTLIASMRGDPLSPHYSVEEGKHSLVPGPGYAGPEIGNGEDSVTCFPVLYPITSSHGPLNMCDTAGFFETRGPLYEAVGVGLGQYVLKATQKPSGFLLVCEFSKFQEGCGRTLIRTLDLLTQIFQSGSKEVGQDEDVNIVMLVSKTPPGYLPTTLREIIQSRLDALLKTELYREREKKHRRFLELLLQRSSFATYGTDNIIHYLPLGGKEVGGLSDLTNTMGSWVPFSRSYFGNLSTVCGGNARNFLGGTLLRQTNDMNAAINEVRSLLIELESGKAQIETQFPDLRRHCQMMEAYSERSAAIKHLLGEGVVSFITREDGICDLKRRLVELDRDDEEVLWENTLIWERGSKGGDNEKQVRFEGDHAAGTKIKNVIVECSSHISTVKSELNAHKTSYLGTFRREKKKEHGSCSVKLTSLYRDLPVVAQARQHIEATLEILQNMQTTQGFLESDLREVEGYVEQTKQNIAAYGSNLQTKHSQIEELKEKLRHVRRNLLVPPKYTALLSVYANLCDSEGLPSSFPSDTADQIQKLRADVDRHLEVKEQMMWISEELANITESLTDSSFDDYSCQDADLECDSRVLI